MPRSTAKAHRSYGKTPPSGNTITAPRSGTTTAPARIPPIPHCRRAPAQATTATTTHTAATGLVRAVTAAAATATGARWRCNAQVTTSPHARPRANGTRPTTRLTAVPTANHTEPMRPLVPNSRPITRSNNTAATTPLAAATVTGPTIADTIGATTL